MMPDQIELTLVLRQPEAATDISARLLAGHFDAAQTKSASIAASPSDVEAVLDFAAAHNLKVSKTDAAARSIHVCGAAADIQKAFGLEPGSLKELNYKGPINLPVSLIAVLGLDHTPIARSHSLKNDRLVS